MEAPIEFNNDEASSEHKIEHIIKTKQPIELGFMTYKGSISDVANVTLYINGKPLHLNAYTTEFHFESNRRADINDKPTYMPEDGEIKIKATTSTGSFDFALYYKLSN